MLRQLIEAVRRRTSWDYRSRPRFNHDDSTCPDRQPKGRARSRDSDRLPEAPRTGRDGQRWYRHPRDYHRIASTRRPRTTLPATNRAAGRCTAPGFGRGRVRFSFTSGSEATSLGGHRHPMVRCTRSLPSKSGIDRDRRQPAPHRVGSRNGADPATEIRGKGHGGRPSRLLPDGSPSRAQRPWWLQRWNKPPRCNRDLEQIQRRPVASTSRRTAPLTVGGILRIATIYAAMSAGLVRTFHRRRGIRMFPLCAERLLPEW